MFVHFNCSVSAKLVSCPDPTHPYEGLVKNGNIPGPEVGIWESQSDRSISN